MCFFFFFFKQKTAYEMRISDWSSDVCSSDLFELALIVQEFFKRNQCLGFEAGIDYDKIVVDAHDFSGNYLTGLHVLVFDTFGKQIGKAFAAGGDRGDRKSTRLNSSH